MIPGKDFMANKQCCRTCGHCTSLQSGLDYWCRLRKIKIHSEILPFVFCHHWTRSAPSLPQLNEVEKNLEMQLDFGRSFASK